MVQLSILSGKMAGEVQLIRRFPFTVGRSAGNNLRLDELGVWDQHLQLNFQKKEGFILQTVSGALAAVNDQPQTSVRLRNGDVISLGSIKIQFWLASAAQRSLWLRETFVWVLLAAVTATQFVLIYWLVAQ